MCIIIYKPAGIVLHEETIRNSWNRNSDGAGFTYVENGQLVTRKGFFKLGEFRDAFSEHEQKQALLHFRIRTNGEKSAENCHPFQVDDSLAFAHNGVLWKMPTDLIKSDTFIFNETVMKHLIQVYGKKTIYDQVMKTILQEYIGNSNKIVFLDNQGKFSILNETAGSWHDGCWFSNESWRAPKPTPPNPKPKHIKIVKPEYEGDPLEYPPLVEQGRLALPSLPEERRESTQWIPIQMGDFVRVDADINHAKKGWIGKILGIYNRYIVEVYFMEQKRIMKMPLIYLTRTKPVIIPPTDYME